ncbi:uncharacterized protein [Aegilops tauschii subsp. strangulata]|uniref:Uncharacterized protein n=2 Tax=Aegilops tauschii subsp. strangulata TaxID=200361 RepID=A0A453SKM5_AEGTS|nr:uncharacterized protein LOC109731439 isoform X2 [Aegilops tauschii subsp. strangulata]
MSLRLPLPQGLSFFKSVGWFEDSKVDSAAKQQLSPTFKLQTDKEVYRPGDSVTATIEICSPASLKDEAEAASGGVTSLLVDGLSFELKGIEKLDSQWFSVPKPIPGSKQRRGEYLFLDCSAPSLISKVIIASGQTKTYIVRLELPRVLPPSYRGISIRYIYYVRSTLFGRLIDLGNEDQTKGNVNSAVQLEARVPLQICVSQKSSNLLNEEGSFPLSIEQLSIFWREKDDESEWIKANDNTDLEEGYDSSKDEVSSVSSYNPSKSNMDFPIRTSTSTLSLSSRLSMNEALYSQGERPTFPSYNAIPRFSVSEISDDHGGGPVSPLRKLDHLHLDRRPSNGERFSLDSDRPKDDVGLPLTPKHVEPSGSEGFMRGRSYNIRIDDQVLLRFSPKNSDSTYYFGDMIGGALTFFHGTGTRRCLEVSITLETSETINPRVIHPSRRVSPTITKVSVQWSLRFEFFTTPAGMDSSRYEHPLLVEKREKGDWVLPITVYAPPMRRRATHGRNDRSALVGNLLNS